MFSIQTHLTNCNSKLNLFGKQFAEILRCLNESSVCGGNTLNPTTEPVTSTRPDFCLGKFVKQFISQKPSCNNVSFESLDLAVGFSLQL